MFWYNKVKTKAAGDGPTMRPPDPFPPSGSAGLWLLYHIFDDQAIAEKEGDKTFPTE